MYYLHLKSGGIYKVHGLGNMEATGEQVVIYSSVENQIVWVRPSSEFIQKFQQLTARTYMDALRAREVHYAALRSQLQHLYEKSGDGNAQS